MRLRQNSLPLIFTLIAASAATAQVQQQQVPGDPNNPNGLNNPNNPNSTIVPSILNHGGGLDEGNVGPFATPVDKQFAQMTAYRAMLEIQLGQMAVEKGTAPGVKALGQRMVDDYTRWQNGLEKASRRLEIKIPTELDAKRKAVVDRLSALNGAEFDQAYVKEMTQLQNRALTITEHEAANAGLTGFRNWAGLMMPTLEEHRKMTKQALTASK